MPKDVNIGLIGYAFMGKAHSHAFKDVALFFPEMRLRPVMKAICGRDETAVKAAAKRYGWESYETDAAKLIRRGDIDVVDISSPGWAHKSQVIAAARAGKHIICEKPIANSLKDAREMAAAVNKAGVKSFVMFNYRRVPAVAFARELIRSGELGEIFHMRACYLQDWITDPQFPLVWRLDRKLAGSGALGDIGSHIIDLARFLVGDIAEVCGMTKTFIKERPLPAGASAGLAKGGATKTARGKVTVDDAAAWLARFENGALGTFEATRFATGRKNYNSFEIYGSKGSLLFNFEEMNKLQFLSRKDGPATEGFREIVVTEGAHPYIKAWWPPGHIIGYEHTFVNAIYDFLEALSRGKNAAPDINDGVRVQEVLEAVERSAAKRSWVRIKDV
ncbi:MAG: Gfo/Idh/MocA family oxidoreductase [Candidatus Sumerlaeaceae bacterium]|nr:Gfo/Idh/MocA family oxidoreductase [Candidatus Sumerlaeaceae bacterium]